MKILHIIPDLPPGGAEMVVMTYLRKFKGDKNYVVEAISLSSNQGRLYERQAAVEKLPISYLGQDIHDNSFVARLKQICEIMREIKRRKPDVIHIHLSILWMVCLASIGTGIKKMFHTLHSNPEKTSYGIHVYVDRFCYNVFNVRTIALNQEMKEKADHLFRLNNTLVLRNGIDINIYKHQPREELRKQFGVSDECFVLGHVGRFNKVKNHTKIVEVFREVKKLRPESKLLLVGDGEELGHIKNMVKEYSLDNDVIFTGARNDVPKMLSMMDCFTFPSLYEGLGIVLIEAQAAGLKCVVSDTVPEETTVTDKVYRLSLSDSCKIWAERVVNDNRKVRAVAKESIDSYDINQVISTLKGYYAYE